MQTEIALSYQSYMHDRPLALGRESHLWNSGTATCELTGIGWGALENPVSAIDGEAEGGLRGAGEDTQCSRETYEYYFVVIISTTLCSRVGVRVQCLLQFATIC